MKNLKNSFKNLAQTRSSKASRGGGIFKSLKKAFRRLKHLDKTKSKFFATLTIISLFCLYVGGTYSYYAITKNLNAATIAIANLKYELTSTNTNFKNNSITVAPGETLDLELNLKSLNNTSTKYALDYINDDPNITVYYVGQKEQNVEGTIAGLNSVITIQIEIKNDSSTNQTVNFNLRGGYIQNVLNSNIVKGAPGILMARSSSSYKGEFWSQATNIKTVVFETEMNPKEDATYSYDVSDKKNKSVMSYLVPDTEDTSKYTLYIQSNGKVYANPNSSSLFSQFTSLETIDGLENLDTSNVTDMRYMFSNCRSLTALDLSNFNTSNVTDMAEMFANCIGLTSLDVSYLDTGSVIRMANMFNNCSVLTALNVNNFITSNITNVAGMFANCSSLVSLDLSNFDTGNVTDMGGMFYNCSNLIALDLSNFNTSKVTKFYSNILAGINAYTGHAIFSECRSLTTLDLSNFDTSNVTDMGYMFNGCNSLTSLDVSNFDTSNVTDMGYMFYNCNTLTELNINNFNTSNVTNMIYMFRNCFNLTILDVSNFDTSSVTNMMSMFSNCGNLTSLNLNNFDTNKVTDMSYMFSGCGKLTTLDVSNFDTSNVIKIGAMFQSCSSLTLLNLGNFDTSQITDMGYMFNGCSKLTMLDVSNFDTSIVTTMESMFSGCGNLTSLNLDNFDTNKITNMQMMFNGCSNLTTLDVSNFDTSNVIDMSSMFQSCRSLTILNLNNFDTSNVINMSYMFNECSSLISLDLSNFDTSKVTNMGSMFYYCSNLTTTITIHGIKATTYYSMFSNAATSSGAQITVNYTADASDLVDKMIATKSSTSNVVKASSPEPEYTITLNSDVDITLSSTTGYKFKEITLNPNQEGYMITSFKMNGQTIEGNSFKMPAENVTITDVVLLEMTIVESEHNPYPNSLNNQEYLNKTWAGATSLTVVIEYQTESTTYDWIYLYDKDNKAYGKYGGTTKKTETIIIPGDTLRIVFKTDSSGNNYYGFKATITPNY